MPWRGRSVVAGLELAPRGTGDGHRQVPERLDSIVPEIHDVDLADVADGNVDGRGELSWALTGGAERLDERPRGSELVHSVAVVASHVHVPGWLDGYPGRPVELPIAIAN